MTDAQAQFRVETRSIDNPKIITLGKQRIAENYRMGLKKVLVTELIDRGFAVKTLSCSKCGLKDDYKDDETTCHRCRKKLDAGRRVARDISQGEVNHLLSHKTMWKCELCGRRYEQPQLCCTANYLLENKPEPQAGYMCMGCRTIRNKKVKCCSDYMMVEGDYYTQPTKDALEKLQNHGIQEVTGIIQ